MRIRDEKLERDLRDGWSKVSDYMSSLDREYVDLDNDCFTKEEYESITEEIFAKHDHDYQRSELVKRYLKAWRTLEAKLLEISRADV